MAKMYKEQMQVGFSKMLPQIAMGQAQSTILANAYFENQLLDLENALDKLLTQECPLCGNEMILSTQIKFGDEDTDDWYV